MFLNGESPSDKLKKNQHTEIFNFLTFFLSAHILKIRKHEIEIYRNKISIV